MPKVRSSKRRPAVALLIESSNGYCRELLRGIRDYLRGREVWNMHLSEHGRGDHAPWFANWRGDGIIARIDTPAAAAAVRAKRLPTVNVSASGYAPEYPSVIADGASLGELAAAHLLHCGIRHFAYCGDRRFAWAKDYGRHFAAALQRSGYPCTAFDSRPRDATHWSLERQRLSRWIAALPKPVGIMACYDLRGQQVLDICQELGLKVPDEVAVIGQHNDEILCEFSRPPLSSVIPGARRAGFEAAALLDRMLQGARIGAAVLKIPASGIAARQSTDVVAAPDSQLAAALRYIREHASEGIHVGDVLRAVPMSRTAFERKFREHLGRTPYAEITRVRLERARLLLATTQFSVATVAAQAGFASPEQLAVAFRKQSWPSPRVLRAEIMKQETLEKPPIFRLSRNEKRTLLRAGGGSRRPKTRDTPQ